ncbi:hypothetical protein K490DRAFT_49468 [Saccharata proteae CBS 121410]|uniref:Uncharacterized protein n=1 Tax=Saccharata proteae CBS 121410 TaxID=1314787 RepID=A0A9P4HQX3_9PEZI|nr:hypothetical protein K490DRAFT_49468 [Saccharata proteae CBS 121410]
MRALTRTLHRSTHHPRPQCLASASTPSSNSRRHASTEALPRVAQSSFWHAIVPRFLRPSPTPTNAPRLSRWQRWRPANWSPATTYIMLAMVVGSNAINFLQLRRETADFQRKADAKIALLKEVIERIGRGEDVDVERILGTGVEEKEREWEEALKEIEEEDKTWQSRKRRKAAAAEPQESASGGSDSKAVAASIPEAKPASGSGTKEEDSAERTGPVGFY